MCPTFILFNLIMLETLLAENELGILSFIEGGMSCWWKGRVGGRGGSNKIVEKVIILSLY